MIRVLALCAAMLADPALTPLEAARGCALAPSAIEASAATGIQPDLLLAIAWRESRFQVDQRNGRHCGGWQVATHRRDRAPYGLTCAELQQAQPGALAGAQVLAYFHQLVHGDTARALQRYAGCKNGCPWYSTAILDRVRAWRPEVATR